MPWFGDENPYESPQEPEPRKLIVPYQGRRWAREEIYETVVDILVDALGVEPDEVTPEATLVEDLGAQ